MEIQCPTCRKFINETDHYCQYCGARITNPAQESETPNLQGVTSSIASKFLGVAEKSPQPSYPTEKAYLHEGTPTSNRASPSPNNLPILLVSIVSIFGALLMGVFVISAIISNIRFNRIPPLNPPYPGRVDSFEQESFPKSACGDPVIQDGTTYYRVFISNQGNNLTMVKQGFCQDAFPKGNSIQVAAFNDSNSHFDKRRRRSFLFKTENKDENFIFVESS